VEFSLNDDILDAASKAKLRLLVAPPESKQIDVQFDALMKLAASLPPDHVQFGDFDSVERHRKLHAEVGEALLKLETLIMHYSWRVSIPAREALADLRDELRLLRTRLDVAQTDLAGG
jgi:hypothetical protein